MKSIVLVLGVLILASVMMTGCSFNYAMPVMNDVRVNDVDFSKINKSGESCATWLLFFIGPFGDNSVKRAVDDGKIAKLDFAEYKKSNFLIVQQECVMAYGH